MSEVIEQVTETQAVDARREALSAAINEAHAEIARLESAEVQGRRLALTEATTSWEDVEELVVERERVERKLEGLSRDMAELDELRKEARAADDVSRAEQIRGEADVIRGRQDKRLRKLGSLAAQIARVFPKFAEDELAMADLRKEAGRVAGATFASEVCTPVLKPFPVSVESLFVQIAQATTSELVRRAQLMSPAWLDAMPDLRDADAPPVVIDGVDAFARGSI